MKKKIFGLFAIMFLVLVAFALPGVAMASVSGVTPASMACLAGDCDEVAAVTAVMVYDTMIKYDLPAPSNYEKGSAISPVVCNGKDHKHNMVLASLDWLGNLNLLEQALPRPPTAGFVQLE